MLKQLNKTARKMLARAIQLGLTGKNGSPLVADLMEELIAAAEGYRNAHAYRAALATREAPALVQEHPDEANNDYLLIEGKGCWITMGQYGVHPYLTDDGIVVDVHANGAEFESIATTWAHDSDAEDALCESEAIDIDDVSEWVGLHYKRNFDTETSKARYDWIKRYIETLKEAAAASAPSAPEPTAAVAETPAIPEIRKEVVDDIVEDVRNRARKYDFSSTGSLQARQWLAQESSEVLNSDATEQEILEAANRLA